MMIYCSNELEIRGSKFQLSRCIEKIAGENGVLDFNKIAPITWETYPIERLSTPNTAKEEHDMLDDFVIDSICATRNDDLSQEQLKVWSVFGNAKNPQLSWVKYRNKPSVLIKFSTALRSPRKVIEALSEQFPLLNFVLHSLEYRFDLDVTYRFTGGKLKRFVQIFTR